MNLEDFKIGATFFASAGYEWLCTDKGSRTINAIMLEPDKEKNWFTGPPYSVDEKVFDEHDMKSCYVNDKDMLKEIREKSSHPNFSSEDASKMSKDMLNRFQYHRKNIMKKDRVGKDGEILHPYSAIRKDDGWYIKTFELFSRQYSEMHENEFVQLVLSDESAMRKRKDTINSK